MLRKEQEEIQRIETATRHTAAGRVIGNRNDEIGVVEDLITYPRPGQAETLIPIDTERETNTSANDGRPLGATRDRETQIPAAEVGKPSSIEDELEVLEGALQMWLCNVRIAQAKWIAGGHDLETRIAQR